MFFKRKQTGYDFIKPIDPDSLILEYQVLKTLGQGGFGTTYLCLDQNLKRKCVLKEYTPHRIVYRHKTNGLRLLNSKSSNSYDIGLSDFLNEARNVALFNHPNIVRINRFFKANNTGYFVMDYEAGNSLRETIIKRNTRFEEFEIEKILLPLCDGLFQLHQKNLIHRDIKPENIIIRKDGTPILIDFGAIGDLNSITFDEYKIYATPYYAPFEQYRPDLPQGAWIDIYALGATLYEMIAGARPQNSIDRILADKLIPISEIGRGDYGTKLLGLIDKCLSLDFRDRPKSVNDFLALLQTDKYKTFRNVVHSITIKAIQQFLNFASPNPGLIVDEFITFIIGFSVLDLTWRLGKGKLMDVATFEKLIDMELVKQSEEILKSAGFTSFKRQLTLDLLKNRLEEYAASYLLDRQESDWTYDLTRKQCARNCLLPDYKDDINGFIELLEDVIDRYRGRIKKELAKLYY